MADMLERQAATQPTEPFSSGSAVSPGRGVFCVLVGLDGSGKTTLARELVARLAAQGECHGVRYYHWLPSVRAVEFPWPEPGNRSRHRALARGPIAAVVSAVRLLKNVLRARLAWQCRLRAWLRRGGVVLVDRYFYNYFLDPASVRYSGPGWLLSRAGRWFPQPHLVVILSAPVEVLRARKQELSEGELREQAARLDRLDFNGARVLRLDSTRPPPELAEVLRLALAGDAPGR